MSEPSQYNIPNGQLSLSGPVDRPRRGTLPIRGDLAHIALAERFLVSHYVMPTVRIVQHGPAPVRLAMDEASDAVLVLEPGDRFEALDVTANWVWGCCGPEGPTGYVARTAFDAA